MRITKVLDSIRQEVVGYTVGYYIIIIYDLKCFIFYCIKNIPKYYARTTDGRSAQDLPVTFARCRNRNKRTTNIRRWVCGAQAFGIVHLSKPAGNPLRRPCHAIFTGSGRWRTRDNSLHTQTPSGRDIGTTYVLIQHVHTLVHTRIHTRGHTRTDKSAHDTTTATTVRIPTDMSLRRRRRLSRLQQGAREGRRAGGRPACGNHLSGGRQPVQTCGAAFERCVRARFDPFMNPAIRTRSLYATPIARPYIRFRLSPSVVKKSSSIFLFLVSAK